MIRHQRQKQKTAQERAKQRFDRSKRGKSARRVGYSLERAGVNYYREQGFFAVRITSRSQKGILRPIDFVAFDRQNFYVVQCKRRLRYLQKEEIERIKLAATQWNAIPLVCWRDNGLKFKRIE